jgi:hypothetical protein
MLEPGKAPDPRQVTQWIGAKASAHWAELSTFIQSRYPGVFDRDWLFGGEKWGWSLRFKRSKSFCTLIPERGQFKALLIFGAEEREKVEGIVPELSSHVRHDYASAPTYHDGKWVAIVVDSKKVLADVERLLEVKRRPKVAHATGRKRRTGKRGAA